MGNRMTQAYMLDMIIFSMYEPCILYPNIVPFSLTSCVRHEICGTLASEFPQ